MNQSISVSKRHSAVDLSDEELRIICGRSRIIHRYADGDIALFIWRRHHYQHDIVAIGSILKKFRSLIIMIHRHIAVPVRYALARGRAEKPAVEVKMIFVFRLGIFPRTQSLHMMNSDIPIRRRISDHRIDQYGRFRSAVTEDYMITGFDQIYCFFRGAESLVIQFFPILHFGYPPIALSILPVF